MVEKLQQQLMTSRSFLELHLRCQHFHLKTNSPTKWQRNKVSSIKSTEWMLLISDDAKGQERCPERSGRFHKSFVSLKDSVFQVIYQSQNGEGAHTHKQVWYSPCWVHPLGSGGEREKEKVGFVIDVSLDNNNSNSTAIQGHAQISSHAVIKIQPLY